MATNLFSRGDEMSVPLCLWQVRYVDNKTKKPIYMEVVGSSVYQPNFQKPKIEVQMVTKRGPNC